MIDTFKYWCNIIHIIKPLDCRVSFSFFPKTEDHLSRIIIFLSFGEFSHHKLLENCNVCGGFNWHNTPPVVSEMFALEYGRYCTPYGIGMVRRYLPR